MPDQQLERLLADLGARAAAEIAQVTAAGHAEAERMRTAARDKAREMMTLALADCEVEEARRRATEVAVTRLRARGALLEAQHAFVNRSMRRASELIAERLRSAGPAAVQHRADVLASYATGGDAQVKRGDDGIHVVADGGHLRIDDTVSTWLEQNRAELAIAICGAVEAVKPAAPA